MANVTKTFKEYRIKTVTNGKLTEIFVPFSNLTNVKQYVQRNMVHNGKFSHSKCKVNAGILQEQRAVLFGQLINRNGKKTNIWISVR